MANGEHVKERSFTMQNQEASAYALITLYQQLDQSQQSYFNLRHQIGPFAYPYESRECVELEPDGAISTSRNFHSKGFGPFPEKRAIEGEIASIWGETSIPMQYFHAIFGTEPTYDHKNKPLSSVEANREICF